MICKFCGLSDDLDGPLLHQLRCCGQQGRVEADLAELPVLDVAASEAGKRAGMGQVAAAADEGFADAALLAVERVARRQSELVCDDVWAQLDTRSHDNRALGPVMKQAERAGWIRATERFQLTAQARRHRAPVRIWASRVYQSEVA